MKIESIKIKNFRSYKDETVIGFNNLTVLVGRNDIGKSTILEALDIFFNDGNGVIKIDKIDLNIQASRNGDNETVISACFSELPESIIIDSAMQTTLASEYMLNSDGFLEVVKKYKSGGKGLYLSGQSIQRIMTVKICFLRRMQILNVLLQIKA